MNELMKSEIFFFVTTIAVIILTIGLAYAFYYLIRILRNVNDISTAVKEEGQLLRGDMQDFREKVRSEGIKLKHLVSFFRSAGAKRKSRKDAHSSQSQKEK